MMDALILPGGAIFVVLIAVLVYKATPDKSSTAVAPKCLNDAKWGNHQYVTLEGGLKMHYVEKGDKEKPLMLFLHGFPEFWYAWRYQLLHYSNKFWCVAPDLRGYGETDKPQGVENYALGDLVVDVKQLIESLGRPKCILVGHDWGGALGYAFCTRHPDMVEAFIGINTIHTVSFVRDIVNSWEQRFKSWYIYFFQIPRLPEFLFVRDRVNFFYKMFKKNNLLRDDSQTTDDSGATKEDLEAYIYTFRDEHTWTCTLNYYRAGARYSFYTPHHPMKVFSHPEIYDHLKKIPVPVYSIFGTGDKYISMNAARGCKDFCEDFEETFLDGVQHFSQAEQPRKVNTLMDSYLSQRGLLTAESQVE